MTSLTVTRTPPGAGRHSPCIGICRLDAATGWCEGCGRSGAEIATWIDADDTRRLEIWADLPARLAKLGMESRVLPWTADEIIGLVARRLSDTETAWAIAPSLARIFMWRNVPGASLELTGTGIVARAPVQTLALTRHDKLRAFADVPDEHMTALGLPKGRAALPAPGVITDCGPDSRATDGDTTASLFDLGLGTPVLRVGIRATDTAVAARIAPFAGRRYNDVARDLVAGLDKAPLIFVAETVLTRVETRVTADELPVLIAEARDADRRIILPAGLVPAWAATILIGLAARS